MQPACCLLVPGRVRAAPPVQPPLLFASALPPERRLLAQVRYKELLGDGKQEAVVEVRS